MSGNVGMSATMCCPSPFRNSTRNVCSLALRRDVVARFLCSIRQLLGDFILPFPIVDFSAIAPASALPMSCLLRRATVDASVHLCTGISATLRSGAGYRSLRCYASSPIHDLTMSAPVMDCCCSTTRIPRRTVARPGPPTALVPGAAFWLWPIGFTPGHLRGFGCGMRVALATGTNAKWPRASVCSINGPCDNLLSRSLSMAEPSWRVGLGTWQLPTILMSGHCDLGMVISALFHKGVADFFGKATGRRLSAGAR